MAIVECTYCKKEMYIKPHKILKQKNHFCSMKCKALFQNIPNNIIIKETHGEIVIKKHNKSLIILFDLDDLEKIKQFKWVAIHKKTIDNYYIVAHERNNYHNRQAVKMHRLVMDCPKGLIVDHINHNTLDNRKQNLRICTAFENARNTKIQKNNKSGYKYVFKYDKKWWFAITQYKKRFSKSFDELEDAIKFRDEYIKGLIDYEQGITTASN